MTGISDTVKAEGGYVDMADGGRLRSVFGVIPEEANVEANVRAACRSSFSLVQTLRTANAARRRRGEEAIEMFAVIHSGNIVAGATGRRGRQHYCIVGDTSETAWRISSFAGNGLPKSGVFMEKDTFFKGQIAAAGVKFESRGFIPVGDQGKSLEIIQVLAECKPKSSSFE